MQAQALLSLVYGTEFTPETIDTVGARMAGNVNETDDLSGQIQILLPNPVTNVLLISFGEAISTDAELLITDYTGRLIKRITVPENTLQATIDVASLSNGIYSLQLMANKTSKGIKRFSKL